MSAIRFDTTPWLTNAVVFGNEGFGVIAQSIASAGLDGPGYAYPSLALPGDNGKEIAGQITTPPSFGTLTCFEDTSFIYVGSGVADFAMFQLYVDGVTSGAPQRIDFSAPRILNPSAPAQIVITGNLPTVSQASYIVPYAPASIMVTGSTPTVSQGASQAVFARLTIGPLKNNTLTVRANLTGLIGSVYTLSGSLVATFTGQGTDAQGFFTMTSVDFHVGTTYIVVVIEPGVSGAIGVDKAVAY